MEQLIRTNNNNVNKYLEKDDEYFNFIIKRKNDIQNSLLNNIDTRSIINYILNIITNTYKYTENNYNLTFVNDVVKHITMIFDIFGITFLANNINDDNSEKFIDIIVGFREDVKDVLKKNSKEIPNSVISNIFTILDDVRDNKLKSKGIIIEDFGKGKNKWLKQI